MAKDSAKPAPDADDAPEAASAPKTGWSLKSLLLFVVAPALAVLVLGGGAAFFLLGGEDPAHMAETGAAHGDEGHGAAGHGEAAVFFDMPEVIVNVQAGEGRPAFLKLAVALEVRDEETRHKIEPLMPRVIDNFQVYLHELRLEDLQGSAGMFRLKEELVRRVNLAIAPSEVQDVLFKEMIIQ